MGALQLQFGRRTIAAPTDRQVERYANPGRVVDFNRARQMARVGRTLGRPRVGYDAGARAGADCPTKETVQPSNKAAFSSGMLDAGPVPLGGGEITIPARVGVVNGKNSMTLQPREGYTVEDVEIGDPSGRILVDSIFAGRCDFLERGPVSAGAFQSAKTMCKLMKGFNAWPSVGIEFDFENPTLSDVPVTVTLSGWPINSPQVQ
jgi:hypothetical protein